MSKLKFILGDKVTFDEHYKKEYITNNNNTSVNQVVEKLKESKIGFITGYRTLPYGTTSLSEFSDFTTKGRICVYLVTTDLLRNPYKVPTDNIDLVDRLDKVAVLKNNHNIISPYEDSLVKVERTTVYKKFGYILRKEVIDAHDVVLTMTVCYSLDGQYIGDNKIANMLCRKKGIREFVKTAETHPPASVGFNPDEQKWYGWSHRAIYGFTIGSSITPGDCGYIPSSKEDMLESMKRFWDIDVERECESPDKKCIATITEVIMDCHYNQYSGEIIHDAPESSQHNSPESPSSQHDEFGILIKTKTTFLFDRKDYTSEHFEPYPKEWKGSWTAKTLEDAKQMATDFANGVS